MRFLAPAALLTASLMVAASASADDWTAPPAAAAAPAMAAPVAPGYSQAPPGYAPAAAPPYMVYPAYGADGPLPYWMPNAPPTERRSNALRTTGIVLFAAGGVITAVGSVIFAAVSTTECFDQAVPLSGSAGAGPTPAASNEHIRSAHQALNSCDTSPTLGLGVMGAGLLTAVAGIPLFVIGSKQVPVRTATGKLAPEVTIGAANASFRWTF
jgi:hypothetical protein